MRRRPAWALVPAVGAALSGLLVGVTALPGHAAGAVQSPAAQAAALSRAVHLLQIQQEQAAEHYDAVEASLGALVTESLLTQQSLQSAQGSLQSSTAEEAGGLRALYEGGGQLGVYSAILEPGNSLGQISDQMESLTRLLQSEEVTSSGQAAVERRIAASTRTLETLAAAQTRLATLSAQAAQSVRRSLAREQQLLAAADARVRALEAEDASAASALDAAQFATLLARAGGGHDNTPATPWAQAAIAAIQTKLGTPYQWGGTGPGAYDCSGLVGYAYEQAGVSMPRTAAQQYLAGTHPSLAQLRPGDLLFWGTDPSDPSTIYHVAMYAGGDLMWSDDHTGDVARLQPIWDYQFFGATRIVPAMAAAVPGARWEAGNS